MILTAHLVQKIWRDESDMWHATDPYAGAHDDYRDAQAEFFRSQVPPANARFYAVILCKQDYLLGEESNRTWLGSSPTELDRFDVEQRLTAAPKSEIGRLSPKARWVAWWQTDDREYRATWPEKKPTDVEADTPITIPPCPNCNENADTGTECNHFAQRWQDEFDAKLKSALAARAKARDDRRVRA